MPIDDAEKSGREAQESSALREVVKRNVPDLMADRQAPVRSIEAAVNEEQAGSPPREE
jgi:hypothetical protein